MTYDKVQFGTNKYHYVNKNDRKSDARHEESFLEDEKIHIFTVKQKRQEGRGSRAVLSNTNETTEAMRSADRDVTGRKANVESRGRRRDYQSSSSDLSMNEELDLQKESENEQHLQNIEEIYKKKSIGTDSRSSQSLSSKESNESENFRSRLFNEREVKGAVRNIPSQGKHERMETNNIAVPKLDLIEDDTANTKYRVTRLSDGASNKLLDCSTPLSVHKDPPNGKCAHLIAKQKHKENVTLSTSNRVVSNDLEKCIICEISDAAAKYAADEANRQLLEIVYPHDFYDKFQRSGRRAKLLSSQRNQESINICKPATVVTKPRREKTVISSYQAFGSTRLDPPNNTRETYRPSAHFEKIENDMYPQKRIKTDTDYLSNKKEVHPRCKPKSAMVITEDSEEQKLVLKGLKGWIVRKEDVFKGKVYQDKKQSIFKISSLGINFGIPEYNPYLSDRKPQDPRPVTCITSPRLHEAYQPIGKNGTHNNSQQHHVTFQVPPRDIKSVPAHSSFPSFRLQRSYTNVPKLFSEQNADEQIKVNKSVNVRNNSQIEQDKTASAGNTNMLLPPIGNEMKSRSLTLSPL